MQPVWPPARVEYLSAAVEPTVVEFLSEAAARGLAPRTRDEYERLIRRFLSRRSFNAEDVHRFVFGPGPSGRQPSPATAAVRRAAIVAFFAFLRRRGHVEQDLAAELPRIRSRPSLPRGLSASELRQLLEMIPSSESGLRDRAIVITAVFTGLRRTELLSLSHADVALGDRPTVTVRVKGGLRVQRDLPPPAVASIRRMLELQHADSAVDGRRLFAISPAGFAANLRRYGLRAGIPNLSPHVLRHTAAKLRREAGAPLEDVAAFLGHASIATTAVYLRRMEGWRDQRWSAVSRMLSLPQDQGEPGMEARAGPVRKWLSERGNAHSADWQGGPGIGTTLPIAYFSSAEATCRSLPPRSPVMAAPAWRDERLSLLKSALQKAIRRGEVELATAVAARLLAVPGGRSALARRLPVIAAEDVGPTWIPAASLDRADDNAILRVVLAMARAPKDKAAYWLAATVWEDRYPVTRASRARFERALRSGEHRQAVALALAAKAARRWRSGERLIVALRDQIALQGHAAIEVGAAALRREALGGSGEAELVAAAVIVAIDGVRELPSPTDEAHPPAEIIAVPWYAADGHTAAGQRALRRIAHRHGLPSRGLIELMFSFESMRVGPVEVSRDWAPLAKALDAEAYGWDTHEQGARIWEALRNEARTEIERELRGVDL